MKIKKSSFGKLDDGSEIYLYTMTNKDNSEVQITNYGAAVVAVKVPDKKGIIEDVVLGFEKLEDYVKIRGFYGAIVGRYGNRIGKGKFTLEGKEYFLSVNDGENHLHGGIKGFDRVTWRVESFSADKNAKLRLSYLSADGEEGYPGNLKVEVVYTFTSNNELKIEYKIKTDKATVINITNHAYFNLSGNLKENILNHELMLNADYFIPVDNGLIPAGEIKSVKNTPMDFTKSHSIGDRINEENEQLKYGLGYDHNWIVKDEGKDLKLAGTLYEPKSGRFMEIYTTEPGIQFYSGNFMDGSHSGHNGIVYNYRYAMCLETQHYPDSPNHNNFPSTVLKPGEIYESTTIYKFSSKIELK
ncbi:aldose epimerase family protein [Bacteroidota bacterium]